MTLAVTVSLGPVTAGMGHANPLLPAAMPTDQPQGVAVDEAHWRRLRQSNAKVERSNPGVAARSYRAFLRANPNLEPRIAIDVLAVTIGLYETRLKDTGTAAAMRKWALEKYAASPEVDRLRQGAEQTAAGVTTPKATEPPPAAAAAATVPEPVPVIPAASPAVLAADEAKWRQLRAAQAHLSAENPGLLALRYRAFLRRNPTLQPKVALEVLAAAVDIYEDRLNDSPTAAVLRKWGQEKYAESPEVARLQPFPSNTARRWTRLREASAALETSNPALAALNYWHFLKANPDLDPAVIANAAGALIPLYRDRLKDTDAAITIRTWALRQCANRPDLLRTLPTAIASRVREGGQLAAGPKPGISMPGHQQTGLTNFGQPHTVTMWPSPSARLGGGRRPDGVAPPTDWPISPNQAPARIFLTAATTPTSPDEFARIPVATRQALKPLLAPPLPTPAELWKVPATALNPVAAPNQTWNQDTLNETAKAVVRDIKLGRLFGAVPSQSRLAAGLRREKLAEQAFAQQRKRGTALLAGLYNRATQEFWSAEPPAQDDAEADSWATYWQPAAAQATLYKKAAANARQFLRIQSGMGRSDRRTTTMLYLTAMSEMSSGQPAAALETLDWLLQDYPGYRDPSQNAVSAQIEGSPPPPELIHLRIYLLLQSVAPGALAPTKLTTSGPMPQTVASSPLPIVGVNAATLPAYVKQLLKNQTPLQMLREVSTQGSAALSVEAATRAPAATPQAGGLVVPAAPTPGTMRASGVAPIGAIVRALHEALLPMAIAKDGMRPVRAHLRGLLSPAAVSGVAAVNAANDNKYPFASYAAKKLLEIDKALLAPMEGEAEDAISQKRWNDARTSLRKIVAEYDGMPAGQKAKDRLVTVNLLQYQDDARLALAQNRFADARALYKRIQAEFPNSAAATQALADLKKTVPVAVNFYLGEGERTFNPGAPAQFAKPQTEAGEFFRKSYEEDPLGPQADLALYKWARALGTQGKSSEAMQRYDTLLAQYPTSRLVADALFAKGFLQGTNYNKKYSEAVLTMKKIAKLYPKSERAAEGLWYSAFWLAYGQGNPDQAKVVLEELRSLPASPYHRLIDVEISKYHKLNKTKTGRN